MEGISVIICCYNSSQRIPETMHHLFDQKGISIDKWEIIIVDNACTDDTASVVSKLYHAFDGNKPVLKIIEEPQPGLSSARMKGITEAKFDYVVFCDDDNWLSENYLSIALQIMSANNEIAVLGGMGEPVFETEEPPYFWRNQSYLLAVGAQSDKDEEDLTNTRKVVYGAGMVINKIIFNELISLYDFTFQSSDRKGNSLFSGGDYELCLAMRRLGYKIYYSNQLRFKHYIPKQRTTIQYYKKLMKGFGSSNPSIFVYSLNKNNFKSYKNDYRYILLRQLKNIVLALYKLLLSGYLFSKNKYKYLRELYDLYTNYGALLATLKTKNHYKNNFIQSKLFLA